MRELLWKYLIGPIIADAKNTEQLAWQGVKTFPGYNPVNTAVYAALALSSLYLVYKLIRREEFEFNSSTALYSIPFMLLGGTLRFLEDAAAVPYPYNIILITPLIYFLIAALYLPGMYYLEKKRLTAYGSVLLLPALILAALQVSKFDLLYFLGTISLSGALTAAYYFVLKERYTSPELLAVAFSQFYGGTASMLAGYFGEFTPKQMLGRFFYRILGSPGVLLMKFGVLGLALYILKDLDEEPLRGIALIVLYAVGLGTGFRVFLRVLAGV